MTLRSLSILVGIGLFAAGGARAETLVFQEGTLLPGGAPYASAQDTEIAAAGPTIPSGSKVTLRTDLESFGGEAQALVRFDSIFGALPDRIPPGSTIHAATLTLEVFNASNTPIGVISVYRMTTPWNEASTWSSLDGGVQVGVDTPASADAARTVESLGSTSFDVLQSLAAWTAGERNAGWALLNDSTDGVEFWSSEYSEVTLRPLLTVSFTPLAPVPAVPALSRGGLAALFGAVAIVGAAALRRPVRSRARGSRG